MSYSIEFLDDPNWDGAGLDLEFRLVFDQPMLITVDDLVCIRTTEVKIVRWECLTHKGSECGRSLTALDLFLRTIGEVTETIMLQLKVMEQEFYLEISPPCDLAIGGPAKSFYHGNEEQDFQQICKLLSIASCLVCSRGRYAFSFAFEGEAERLADVAADNQKWASGELRTKVDGLTNILCELRNA